MTKQARIPFEFNQWISQFENVVDSDRRAAPCWRSLIEGGMEPLMLSALLAYSCKFEGNPASQFFKQLRSDVKDEIRTAIKLANRLDQDREILRSFKSVQPELLSAKMEECAINLRRAAQESRRLCKKSALNSDLVLMWLIHNAQESTGRPHYKEISTLLECAYAAYGEDMPMLSEENLRKAYQRFQRTSPLKELLSPEVKQTLLIIAFVVLIAKLVESLATLPSPPPRELPDNVA